MPLPFGAGVFFKSKDMKVRLIRKVGKVAAGVYDWPEETVNKLVKLGFAEKMEKVKYENKVLKTAKEIKIVQANPGWFDVTVNGEAVNNKKLRKAEAEELVKTL